MYTNIFQFSASYPDIKPNDEAPLLDCIIVANSNGGWAGGRRWRSVAGRGRMYGVS